jgi:dihydrofolate reductase
MRRVVLYTICSLDGAVDDPTRAFPAATEPPAPPSFDEELATHEARLLEAQDAVLMGRGMYDEWARFWPTSDEQPFADFINGVRKYVVTSRPLEPEWTNAEAVTGPLPELVERLKSLPGKDIGVHGSITLAQSLLALDLVDEVQLAVAPVLDPVGRRLSGSLPDLVRLRLVSSAATAAGALWLVLRPERLAAAR